MEFFMSKLFRLPLTLLVILLSLFWLTAAPTAAQDEAPPGLSLTAVAGFDGYYKSDAWLPVHITVSNNGPAVSGELRIATGTAASSNLILYTAPIELPTQSSKQVTLYVYLPSHAQRLTVQLVNQQGATLFSAQTNTLRSLERAGLLYAVLSGDAGRLSFLETIDGGRPATAVANLTIAQLPDLPAALGPLDIILFHDVDSGQLTPAQRDALSQWVSLGGQLVVAGGPGWPQTTAGLDQLLPVTVQSSRSVADLPELAAWAGVPLRDPGPYATAVAVLRRGEALIQDGDLPLLVKQDYGRGAVYFLALDPTLAPLRDWDGNETLWSVIADNAPLLPGWAAGFQQGYAAAEAVQIIPGVTLPSIFIIILFMVGYVVLIGPVNYFVVRRLNRRELAWVTIPAIILLFSVGTYLAGAHLMGQNLIVNQMSVAYGHMDSDVMRVNALATIYSPRRASYDLTMPGDTLARPFSQEYYGGVGLGQGGDVAAMERDSQLIARRARVDIGGLRNMTAEFHRPRPPITGQAAVSVDASGNIVLTAYLQNNGDWTLENGTLIYGDSAHPLGDLTAGASLEKTFLLGSVAGGGTIPAPYGYYGSPAASLIQSNMEQFVGGLDYWNSRPLYARHQLLQSLLSEYYGGGSGGVGVGHLPVGVVTLVGWSDDSAASLAIDPGVANFEIYRTTLYFLEMPVTENYDAGGSLRVPRALLDWRVLDSEGFGGYGVGIAQFYLPTGRLDYEFTPTVRPNNAQAVSLSIILRPGSGGAGQPPPAVSLWNWQMEAWELVENIGWEETAVADFAAYIGPNQSVRLRLQNPSPFGYEIEEIYPLLELQ
jgi:hypothetical protein